MIYLDNAATTYPKPEEVYKLDNAKIAVQGNYVALIVSDDADQIEAAFRNVISKGAE